MILMLKRISCSDQISKEYQCQPVLRLLLDTAQELMLDLFEVAILDIYLRRFGWEENLLPAHYLILNTGYAAKVFMGSNISHINEYLNRKAKNFENNFNVWIEKYTNLLEVDIIEINETYKILSEDNLTNVINYNYYVDDVLQISPPYQIEGKNNALKKENKVKTQESSKNKLPILKPVDANFSLNVYKNEINFMPYHMNSDSIYNLISKVCTEYQEANNIPEIFLPTENKSKIANSYLAAISHS